MRTKSTNLTGQCFGRWRVLSHHHQTGPHHYYHCICDCGEEKIVQAGSLKLGTSRSCGCLRAEVAASLSTTHGATGHPAYQSWAAMRRRCNDHGFEGFAYYGARGIAYCAAWETFEGFWSDMGETWADGLTIDRIDPNGNYEPGNCRWATDIEQANNKRSNVIIDTPWGKLTRAQAARKSGLSYSALKHRMDRGWPTDRLFEPMRVA